MLSFDLWYRAVYLTEPSDFSTCILGQELRQPIEREKSRKKPVEESIPLDPSKLRVRVHWLFPGSLPSGFLVYTGRSV
ncbi:hypothetical protein EG68_03012 [Paragonimus skrjabini miyazakii]|uniref:Uncharacterized protein n=1 Tax=Paragonimus skrjabini miyazakii TaxID=59628 RepID=A0A8S9Z9D9_9TREM|nr:hypothetical protein EG68_03012 [Paragonimus skrjabini miyazakii]